MTETTKDTETGKDRNQADFASQEHEKVPEAAENMEHTLRRLAAEKAKKRAKNPGLYL